MSVYQYSVYQPPVAISACTRCGILSTKPFKTSSPMSHQTSINRACKMLRMCSGDPPMCFVSAYRWWSSHLRWAHNCLIRFMSGEFESQCMTENPCALMALSRNSLVRLAVCEVALSCWNTMFVRPSAANASIKGRKVSFRMSIYTSLLTIPLTKVIGPRLLPTKHPQIICDIFPPRDFGWMFLIAYFSFLFCRRKICNWQGLLSFCTAHSSDHATFRQSSTVQCQCAFAQLRQLAACFLVNNMRFTAFYFRMPASRSRCRMVCWLMFKEMFCCNSCRGTRVSISAVRTMYRSSEIDVLRALPGGWTLSIDSRSSRRCRKLVTVRRGMPNCLPISWC